MACFEVSQSFVSSGFSVFLVGCKILLILVICFHRLAALKLPFADPQHSPGRTPAQGCPLASRSRWRGGRVEPGSLQRKSPRQLRQCAPRLQRRPEALRPQHVLQRNQGKAQKGILLGTVDRGGRTDLRKFTIRREAPTILRIHIFSSPSGQTGKASEGGPGVSSRLQQLYDGASAVGGVAHRLGPSVRQAYERNRHCGVWQFQGASEARRHLQGPAGEKGLISSLRLYKL